MKTAYIGSLKIQDRLKTNSKEEILQIKVKVSRAYPFKIVAFSERSNFFLES